MQIPMLSSFLLLCTSLYTDLLWRKIPNYITMSAIVIGFWFYGIHSVTGQGLEFALKGLLTGIGILILPFIMGGTGGGDVKLFGALGALLGSQAVLSIFIYTAITGGVICLFLLLKKQKIRAVKEIIYDVSLFFLCPGKKMVTKKAGYIPYSIPTACGYAIYIMLGDLV